MNKENCIVVELYISDNKELFDKLLENKEAIENSLGFALNEWARLNEKKASRIKYYIDGLNFNDHSNYPDLMNKSIDAAVKMRQVFKKYM